MKIGPFTVPLAITTLAITQRKADAFGSQKNLFARVNDHLNRDLRESATTTKLSSLTTAAKPTANKTLTHDPVAQFFNQEDIFNDSMQESPANWLASKVKINPPDSQGDFNEFDGFGDYLSDMDDANTNDLTIARGSKDWVSTSSAKLVLNGGITLAALSLASHAFCQIEAIAGDQVINYLVNHQLTAGIGQEFKALFEILHHHQQLSGFEHTLENIIRHSSMEVELSPTEEDRYASVRLNLKWGEHSPTLTLKMKAPKTLENKLEQQASSIQTIIEESNQFSFEIFGNKLVIEVNEDKTRIDSLKFVDKDTGYEAELPINLKLRP